MDTNTCFITERNNTFLLTIIILKTCVEFFMNVTHVFENKTIVCDTLSCDYNIIGLPLEMYANAFILFAA
jgi:hypothetical protein